MTQAGTNGSSRLAPLDAVRGVAALIVVFHHAVVSIPLFYWADFISTFFNDHPVWTPTIRAVVFLTYTPLHLLWAGNDAVLLFFVLSGFVLSLPFWQGRRPSYARFLIRRFCRIYLPYAAALGGAWGLSLLVPHSRHLALSPWFQTIWSRPVDAAIALDHALMLGAPSANVLDNPVWSLVHEMRVSIGFPLLILLASWGGWLGGGLVFACSAFMITPHLRWPLSMLPTTLADTAHFAVYFLWGALLAKYRAPLGAWLRRRHAGVKLFLWGLALLCFTFDWSRWLPKGLHHGYVELVWHQLELWRFQTELSPEVVALGAGAILLLSLETARVTRFLERPSLQWLGQVSYSLYLVHVPVLAVLAYTVGRLVPGYWFLLLVPPASLLVASLFHRWIEKPAIALGYRLGRKRRTEADFPKAA